ncbi:MAG TPA: methyltetrahydrofolate cobalamin methyltransferase [Armatimonadota bacterium]|nr:methyltetrahydrofolate cobalamin methyltransferase [Armatimonadota bacterium]
MIIVAERINGTRTRVRDAVMAREAAFIAEEARRQAEAGADYIDVNAGTNPEREAEDLAWLVQIVQQSVDKPVCIDSPNVEALEVALKVTESRALVNSVSAESSRMDAVLALVKEHGARVIGLTMDDAGLPKTAQQRIGIAQTLVARAQQIGLQRDDVFIDPLARAVAVENEQGSEFLGAVAGIRDSLPGVHVICGLSNISFQMPARRLLNRTFLAMAMARGMDAAILDPLDGGLMAAVCAGTVLLGEDEMCMEYIQAHRAGRLADWS